MNFISEKSDIKMRKPKIVFVGTPDHHGKHFLEEAKIYAKTVGLDMGPDVWISDSRQGKTYLILVGSDENLQSRFRLSKSFLKRSFPYFWRSRKWASRINGYAA
jgi:hypothetical protein